MYPLLHCQSSERVVSFLLVFVHCSFARICCNRFSVVFQRHILGSFGPQLERGCDPFKGWRQRRKEKGTVAGP